MKKKIISWVLAFIMVSTMFVGISVEAFGQSFPDIKTHWAKSEIEEWTGKGLVSGFSDGTFKPNDNITRAEFITLINNVLRIQSEAEITFDDVNGSEWYFKDLKRAIYGEYIAGYEDNTFRANGNITRQEVAVILQKIVKQTASEEESIKKLLDTENIPIWSRSALQLVVQKGYLTGYTDNSLRASNFITRAESVQVLSNLFGIIYNEPGVYGPSVEEELLEIKGNVTVSVEGVTLKNMMIGGDLYLAEGIGEGEVILDNTTVTGETIVKGGGTDSIIITGHSVIGSLVIAKVDGVLRVYAEDGTEVGKVIVDGKDDVILEGVFEDITILSENITAWATEAEIDTAEVVGENSKIVVRENTTLKKLILSGPRTEAQIFGNVEQFETTEEATDSVITVEVDGKVDNVVVNSQGTIINGEGTVDKVLANANGVVVKTIGAEVTAGVGIEGVMAGDKEVPEKETKIVGQEPTIGGSVGGGTSRPPATLAVSAITVTGDAVVGETLTATPTPSNATGNYQWEVSDSGTDSWTNISGATSSTYVIAPEYTFDYIRVSITGTGSYTGTQTSNATAQIQESTDASLVSILGETDSSPGGNGETSGTPITWDINVANTVETLGIADIQVAIGATVGIYSDATFSANSIATISLIAGEPTVAYIKVTAQDTSARYYAVMINRDGVVVEGIVMNEGDQTINVGATTQFTVTVEPPSATNQTVRWSSSDNSVATVDASGLVTGVTAGPTVITVTTNDGGYTATVNVSVESVVSGSFTVLEGSNHNGVVSRGTSNYYLVSGPAYGMLTFNSDGSFTYSAHRQPTLGFVANDSFVYNSLEGNEYTVSITITPINDAPVASDASFHVTREVAYNGQLSATDVDGDAPTYSLVTAPSYGNVTVEPGGGFSYTWTDIDNPATIDTFTFKAHDGLADSNIATVTLTAPAINNNPVAMNDAAILVTGSTTLVDVLLNDTDEDGDTLSITGFTQGANGVVSAEGDSLRYKPEVSYAGTDSFTYEISDGNGGTDSATVNIIVGNYISQETVDPDSGFITGGVFRYPFTIISEGNFVLETTEYSSLRDTVMHLYDSSNNLIASNDDYIGNYATIATYLTSGDYYILVTEKNSESLYFTFTIYNY